MLKNEKILMKNLVPPPELRAVDSNKKFGIVKSRYMETFGSLLEIKIEDNNVFDNVPQAMDEDQGVIELEVTVLLAFNGLISFDIVFQCESNALKWNTAVVSHNGNREASNLPQPPINV